MKKNTILYILIIVLIIINGFFLFNYLGRPEHKGPKESGNFISKELKFDEAQLKQYNLLEEKHHNAMKVIGDDIRTDKDALFQKITSPQIHQASIDSLITSISNKETLVEKDIFNRLRSIYELCDDEQKERFNEIIIKARRIDRKRPERPRK